jgi:hypothetical protein
VTETFKVIPATVGYVIDMGTFTQLYWYKEARAADPDEIKEALDIGFELAVEDVRAGHGEGGVKAFSAQYGQLLQRINLGAAPF